MAKLVYFSALIVFISCILCKGQNKTDLQTDNTPFEAKEVITPNVHNGITRNIIQDEKGNIWLATFGGVFKYDGKSFINVTGEVSKARFFSVLEDKKGNFWFGSIGSGVYYYDGKSFQNFTTQQGLAGNGAIHIYEDKKGNIWFGASRYDPSTPLRADGKSFQNYQMNGGLQGADSDDNDVNTMLEDKTGKFWFGTRGNAYTYDGKKFTILTNKGEAFTNVRTIIEDKKGNIWLGGRDGLWRYDGSTFTNFTLNFVGCIYEDKNGNIWTTSKPDYSYEGGDRWALSRYDANTLSNPKPIVIDIMKGYEDYKNMLFGILEANDGSIWFGALDGVRRFDGKTITYFRNKEL